MEGFLGLVLRIIGQVIANVLIFRVVGYEKKECFSFLDVSPLFLESSREG